MLQNQIIQHKRRFSSWSSTYGFSCIAILAVNACSISGLVDVDDPSQSVTHETVNTYAGAVSLYYGAVGTTARAISDYSRITGLMTDELQAASAIGGVLVLGYDSRDSSWLASSNSNWLWFARVNLQHARGALEKYSAQAPAAYLGELYALEGMVDVLLAEGYCSGIPLSRASYGQNFQYAAGSTTEEVLNVALALFDSALVFGQDSAPVATLARVGKARAFLNLNNFEAAAAAIASVATSDRYVFSYMAGNVETAHWTTGGPNSVAPAPYYRVGNREGWNGLDWLASTAAKQDPRIPMTTMTVDGVVQFTTPARQAKFISNTVTQVLADGIEARLIEAEVALRDGELKQWESILNTLRTTAITPSIPEFTKDSTEGATPAERVNITFRERALWLYLTGHRQGDLRRLVRQYDRPVEQVFPWGAYTWPTTERSQFGKGVLLEVPKSESEHNSLYRGCFDQIP